MPQTTILAFCEGNGEIPLWEWLETLRSQEPKAYAKCLERILRLSDLGYELRRPISDTLRDGIHELRASHGNVNYRILYFFCGENIAVLSHGFTKESKVPAKQIKEAIDRKKRVEGDVNKYTAEFNFEEGQNGEN